MNRHPLPVILEQLKKHYGQIKPLFRPDPWEMILWENVAYLADDDLRRQAFGTLKKQVGLKPEQILAADDEALLTVTRHGIMPEKFAQKLRDCARIALEEFDGDLRAVLRWPRDRAMKTLRKFPGVGEPGAEKILLFTRTIPVLALDSNGLRVLQRLGLAEEKKSYASSYQSAQRAVAELPQDCAVLIDAHLLLRRHGQDLCRRTKPLCEQCPVSDGCEYFQR